MRQRLEYALMALSVTAGVTAYFFFHPLDPAVYHVPRSMVAASSSWTSDSDVNQSHELSDPERARPLAAESSSKETTVNEWVRGLSERGSMYLNGKGVERDFSAAFEFFSLAAQLGDPFAMDRLGWIYENGLAREADRKKAMEFYARAAQAGYPLAQLWHKIRLLSFGPLLCLVRSRRSTRACPWRMDHPIGLPG